MITNIVHFILYIAWGLATGLLIWWIYKKWESKNRLSKRIQLAHANLLKAPQQTNHLTSLTILENLMLRVEDKAEVAGFKWSFKFYITISLALCAIGMFIGAYNFSSIKISLLLGITGLMIPDQIIGFGISSERQKISKQLSSTIEIFTTEYNDTQNIQAAMTSTHPQLPQPIRGHFETVSRRLNNGEEYHEVFNDLAKHLQSNFGHIFCNICISCYENSGSGKLFDNLQAKIAQRIIRERENKTQLFTPKLYAIALLLLTPILFIVNVKIQPSTYYLFTQTQEGKNIVSYAVISAFLGFFVNKLLSKVGD